LKEEKMRILGRDSWREDAKNALDACNEELIRMHKLLLSNDDIIDHMSMTRDQMMERIIKIQDTLIEGTRRLCGLEY
jgi:hypothetical protein